MREQYFTILLDRLTIGVNKEEAKAMAVEVTTSNELLNTLAIHASDTTDITKIFPMQNMRMAEYVAEEFNTNRDGRTIEEIVHDVTHFQELDYIRQDPEPDNRYLSKVLGVREKEKIEKLLDEVSDDISTMRDIIGKYAPDGTYVEDLSCVLHHLGQVKMDLREIFE